MDWQYVLGVLHFVVQPMSLLTMVLSVFFGLIVASSVLVAKEIKHWHIGTVISLIAGGCIAYVITVMSPAETPNTWWFIILSGAIAICAMILPGISGAFIFIIGLSFALSPYST